MIRVDRPLLARTMATITDRDEAWWDRNKPTNAASLFVSNSRVAIRPDNDWCATITHQSPAEAWEALVSRGVLGEEALDTRRSFACEDCGGECSRRGESVAVHADYNNEIDSVSIGDRVSLGRRSDTVVRSASDRSLTVGIVVGIVSPTRCVVRTLSYTFFPCRACGGRGLDTCPLSFSAIVSVSSAWPSILAAEAIARESCARLAKWGVKPCEKIVWSIAAIVDDDVHGGWPQRAHEHSVGSERWNDIVERYRADGEPFPWWRAHVETWSLDDPRTRGVESQHAPILTILRSGLQVDRIGNGTVTMKCPPIGST
jgi:hypothetical protein